jgi:cytochrome c-type biogenesis protein CcmH
VISLFWVLAPALIAIAVLLLAVPLWRRSIAANSDAGVDALGVLRDQKRELDREVEAGRMSDAERAARIADLSRRVIDEGLTAPPRATPVERGPVSRRALAIAVALAIPAIALPLYWVIGTPAALDPAVRAPATAAAPHDMTPERFRIMLADLKSRLDANPGDADGWRMLAGGLRLIEDLPGSADAFAKASALRPDDAALLVDYADALALTRNRDLSGKPFELIQKALSIDPRLPKALAMAGAAEWAQGHRPQAKAYWTRLLAVIPADSDDAGKLRGMLAQIESGERNVGAPGGGEAKAAGAAPSAATSGTTSSTAAAGPMAGSAATAISGTVRIASELAKDVGPNDTLYVLARPAQGPRMPLAVLRRKGSELPLEFRLDDAQAMPGGAPLSSASQVRVEARISRSGDAMAKPGDLRGQSEIVAPGASNLNIVIDQIVR